MDGPGKIEADRARRSRTLFLLTTVVVLLLSLFGLAYRRGRSYAQASCTGEFIPVSTPLNDLGANEYVRMDGTPTGFIGGLYPGGEQCTAGWT